MYIGKTNSHERLIIDQAMIGVMERTSRTRRILAELLCKYFEDSEQKAIGVDDAECIHDIILCATDLLYDAELEYSLTVGEDYGPGVRVYFDGYERAHLARKVDKLRAKIGGEKTKHLVDLDDEQALPLLEALAKEL